MSQNTLADLRANIENIFPASDDIKVDVTQWNKNGYAHYQIFLNTLETRQSKDHTTEIEYFRNIAEDYLREHEYIIEKSPYTSSNVLNRSIEIVIRAKKKIESEE